jgi:hypothetical protein
MQILSLLHATLTHSTEEQSEFVVQSIEPSQRPSVHVPTMPELVNGSANAAHADPSIIDEWRQRSSTHSIVLHGNRGQIEQLNGVHVPSLHRATSEGSDSIVQMERSASSSHGSRTGMSITSFLHEMRNSGASANGKSRMRKEGITVSIPVFLDRLLVARSDLFVLRLRRKEDLCKRKTNNRTPTSRR